MSVAAANANGAHFLHGIVFIDTSVSGYQALPSLFPADSEIVMIDQGQDGIAQITAALSGKTGIGAIHVISHGEAGILEIGSSVLTDTSLPQFASQIRSWSAALAPGANILLYGCDLASNPAGQSLVQSIASLTAAAVAAATHLVGDAALGGISALDYDVGTVATAAIDTSGLDDVLTHFRASNLTWNVTSGRTVQFNMQNSFRASYPWPSTPVVGAIINSRYSFDFGDGTSTPIYLKVLSVITLDDYFVGQFVTSTGTAIAHTYAADLNYTASWENMNRISTSQNFADQGWRAQTIVDVGRSTQSPVSALPAIIQIADNAIATFQIPATNADGDTLVYKLGTANQFISSGSSGATVVAPAGLSVNSATGLVTWDIRNSVQPAVAVGQLWVATVMVEAHDRVTGVLKTETPLDFLLKIVDTSSNKPPVFTVVPPTTTINVGQTKEVVLVATDPANQLTSITALNPPIGLTTLYHASEGELHVDFTPTAAEAGSSFVVNFQALDAQGLTTNTSVIFTVPLAYPVVTLEAQPAASNVTHAVLGSAVAGAGNDPLTVTLTSDAAFASGSSITLSNGVLTYTPGLVTAAKAGADIIHYTVTDTVSGAVTHETQTVALGNGPTPAVTLATAPHADNTHTALLGTAAPGLAGDALSVRLTSDADFATGSSLTLTAGQLVYTPGLVNAAKVGPDAISYTVTDLRTGAVTSETQIVTLSNGPSPIVTRATAPTANRHDPAILGTAIAGLNNDPLIVTLNSDSNFIIGSSITLAGGILTYTPGLVTIGNIGSDTLGYTVTDTVTGASTYETQTLTLTLLDVKSNNTVYLSGQSNSVTGPLHRALSSQNQGAEIDQTPWISGGTITGTPDTETIRVLGYNNTIIADGGDDTIYAGSSDEHVIVSDFDGDNIVKGFVNTSKVVLGDGNNTIDLGGYGNSITLGNGNSTVNASAAQAIVVVGDGDNTIIAAGYDNVITTGSGHDTIDAGVGSARVTIAGGTSSVTAGGYYNVFHIAGGTTSLGGFTGYATVNMGQGFGTADSIDLRDTASDIFTFSHGQMLVTKADGELVATINTPGGKIVSAIDDGAGGHRIVLGLVTPPAPPVITETQWGVTLDLGDATKTVHLAGFNNTVTGGNGNHSIDGDFGGLNLSLQAGNNTVAVHGYGDTITLGAGNNTVSGTVGSTVVHTGAGNQAIATGGFYNDIQTGAGNSTLYAGAGYSHVDAGSGTNTITADGNQNKIATHLGENTVALSGWNNLIQAGAGHTVVTGGYANTYEVSALGTSGGVEVTDFSTLFGDVLNLHDVIGIGSKVSVADGATGNLLVSVDDGSHMFEVANLHGMAGNSLATLFANHSVTV
jgi:hypothetical protein